MAIQRDIDDARALLVEAEEGRQPDEKISALEDALDLLDIVNEEAAEGTREYTVGLNLRRSYARRLLVQLVQVRSADILMWFGYAQLLLTRLSEEVDEALRDPDIKADYEAFFAIWPADVRKLLDESRPT